MMNWMTSAKKRIYKSKSSKEHLKRQQASRKLTQQKEMMHKEFSLLQALKDQKSDNTHSYSYPSKKRSIDDVLLNNSPEYFNKAPQVLNKTLPLNQPTHNSSQQLQTSSVNPDNFSSLHVINQQIDLFEFSSQESTIPSHVDHISQRKNSYPKNNSILFINDGKIVDNLSMKTSTKEEEEIEKRYLPKQETKPLLAEMNLLTPLGISHTWNLFEGELTKSNYPKELSDQFTHSKSVSQKNKAKEQSQERYLVHSDEELDPNMFL